MVNFFHQFVKKAIVKGSSLELVSGLEQHDFHARLWKSTKKKRESAQFFRIAPFFFVNV